MSYTLNMVVELKDWGILEKAAKRLGWTCTKGSAHLYDGTYAGMVLTPPDWSYPIIVDEEGNAKYESAYGSKMDEALGQLKPFYGIEKAKKEAASLGHTCIEGKEGKLNIDLGGGKVIDLEFDIRTGECKIEAEGFKGSSCEDATKFLRETLGETVDTKKKLEYFEANLQLSELRQRTNLCG